MHFRGFIKTGDSAGSSGMDLWTMGTGQTLVDFSGDGDHYILLCVGSQKKISTGRQDFSGRRWEITKKMWITIIK